LINIICSAAIILSSVYIVSCTAFYAPAAAEEISMDVNELYGAVKGYPLGGLSIRSGLFFCTLIPIGLTAWFPSAVLLGKNPPALPAALTIIVAAIFTAIAVILFKKGMNYYAKYGSNRYSGFGHR
jgi:ABC-2 type transport system permease protein